MRRPVPVALLLRYPVRRVVGCVPVGSVLPGLRESVRLMLGPRDRRNGGTVIAECPLCGNTFHDLTDMLIEGGVLKGTWMECRQCGTTTVLEPSH